MPIEQSWLFFTRYLKNPKRVGSIAPSSRALAEAICEPYRQCDRPARVLEVGAGTGAVTRYLGTILKPEDELDVCEIQPEFLTVLERDVLTQPTLRPAVDAGRVSLLRQPVQQLPGDRQYDFVISGLPLTVFALRDVQDIYSYFRRCLRSGGVFSYYEYIGLRRTTRALSLGRDRDRIRAVHDYLNENIRHHQSYRRTVLGNIPPAHARHLRFDVDYKQNGRNGNGRSNGRFGSNH